MLSLLERISSLRTNVTRGLTVVAVAFPVPVPRVAYLCEGNQQTKGTSWQARQ